MLTHDGKLISGSRLSGKHIIYWATEVDYRVAQPATIQRP